MSTEGQLGRLGVEIWRLQMRVRSGSIDRVDDSLTRLLDLFAEMGGVIDDPIGQLFPDGSVAEIIAHDGPAEPGQPLIVTDTVRPGIYVDGRLAVIPQVILGIPREQTDGSAAHD